MCGSPRHSRPEGQLPPAVMHITSRAASAHGRLAMVRSAYQGAGCGTRRSCGAAHSVTARTLCAGKEPQMQRPWSRQVGGLMAVIAAAAALGLAGCSAGAADGSRGSGGSAAGAQEDDSGEQVDDAAIVQAPADLAGSTSLPIEAGFTPVEENDEARLLAPGVDLRITEVAQTDALSVEVVEDLGAEVEQTEDEAPVEMVQAADGHVFWIARYTSDDPQWEPRGEVPDSTATLALSGNEVADVFTTSDGTMHRGTVVAS